jgi:hypothetical protein
MAFVVSLAVVLYYLKALAEGSTAFVAARSFVPH